VFFAQGNQDRTVASKAAMAEAIRCSAGRPTCFRMKELIA